MNTSEIAAIFQQERLKLVRYIRSRLTETAEMDAEDVVQEVLANILAKADITLPLENLIAYIYRSVKNHVIDYYRTRKETISLFAGKEMEESGSLIELLHDTQPDAFQVLQSQEGQEALFAALAGLGEMEQRVIIAHDLEGFTFKELAKAWGVSQNTLLSHKARAMKKLEKRFRNIEW
ncbi:sigma-70 family RNA polymerase sigma factor [candidate division FCPU426 bacterium]|nr:sigma-70 family RNA polymerase sigma factor [candidate division FCPU426 bacterium]